MTVNENIRELIEESRRLLLERSSHLPDLMAELLGQIEEIEKRLSDLRRM